jgi:putative two-component system response regulator
MNSIDLETIAGLAAAPIVPAGDRNSQHLVDQVAAKRSFTHRDESVILVDDDASQLDDLQRFLQHDGFHNLLSVQASTEAVATIRQHQPDLVLLDWTMPEVDGRDILQEIRGDERICDTLVIVLGEWTESETRQQAIEFGATDYLCKPILPTELRFRVDKALELRQTKRKLVELSGHLEVKVKARTEELLSSRQEAILCLARAAEYRDDDTGHHVTRVGRYSAIIAAELGFPKASVELIEQAAQLHDVGKIGIPDAILHKPGKLDSDEYARMKRHCGIGRRIISPPLDDDSPGERPIQSSGTNSPVLRMAALIADSHHEKWDGSGYPRGLQGEEIPLAGRIVAVADVFDALASKRPYKEAFPIEKCLSILMDGRGKHFDPRVLDAFLARKDEILQVQQQLSEVAETSSANHFPIS